MGQRTRGAIAWKRLAWGPNNVGSKRAVASSSVQEVVMKLVTGFKSCESKGSKGPFGHKGPCIDLHCGDHLILLITRSSSTANSLVHCCLVKRLLVSFPLHVQIMAYHSTSSTRLQCSHVCDCKGSAQEKVTRGIKTSSFFGKHLSSSVFPTHPPIHSTPY